MKKINHITLITIILYIAITIFTNFIPATDSKDYPPYIDRPKDFNVRSDD